MEENFLEETIKTNLKILIEDKVKKEIEEEVEKFREKLESRKDEYIAEIMKGIRVSHQFDPAMHGINYRIVFDNVITIKKQEPTHKIIMDEFRNMENHIPRID